MAGPFEWLSYAEVGARVGNVASGLAALGLMGQDRVGVYGANCEEWMIAMQASGLTRACGWACMRPPATTARRQTPAAGVHLDTQTQTHVHPLPPFNTTPTQHHHNHPPAYMHAQACNRMSYECVPLYDSLGENAIEFIVGHSEQVAVVVAAGKLPKLAKALEDLAVR